MNHICILKMYLKESSFDFTSKWMERMTVSERGGADEDHMTDTHKRPWWGTDRLEVY